MLNCLAAYLIACWAKSQRQTARREAVREHKSEALFKETPEPPSLQPSQPAFGAFTSVAALFGFRTCRSHRLRCRRTIGRRGWRVNLTTRLAPSRRKQKLRGRTPIELVRPMGRVNMMHEEKQLCRRNSLSGIRSHASASHAAFHKHPPLKQQLCSVMKTMPWRKLRRHPRGTSQWMMAN